MSWSAELEAKSVALLPVLSARVHISRGCLGQPEGLRRALELEQAVAASQSLAVLPWYLFFVLWLPCLACEKRAFLELLLATCQRCWPSP